jgi:hypothetical protein
MIGARTQQVGCNTQGKYIMRHGQVAIMNENNTSNMGASKWFKMTNTCHGASNTCNMIHNIHAHGFGVLERE